MMKPYCPLMSSGRYLWAFLYLRHSDADTRHILIGIHIEDSISVSISLAESKA